MTTSKISVVCLTVIGIFVLVGVFCQCIIGAEIDQTPNPPTNLKISVVMTTIMEEPWNTMLIQALERVQAEHPHDLNISWDITENIGFTQQERILSDVAKTGKYDIIWVHGYCSEAIKTVAKNYPNIMWTYAGAGNVPIGGNAYWTDMYVHEPAYLLGMLAGFMTKTNVIGAVAAYPYPAVNVPINAFKEGAKAVNPDIKFTMTYIESWFDPPKAKEAAYAQIAAGADFIYAERFGPFEACKEKGIYGFGHWVDQNNLAPEVVLSSAMALWDPVIKTIVDIWWDHVTQGTPFDAPMKAIQYNMSQGASDIAPYHSLESKVPAEVKSKVEKAHADIMSNKLKVPYIDTPVKSN